VSKVTAGARNGALKPMAQIIALANLRYCYNPPASGYPIQLKSRWFVLLMGAQLISVYLEYGKICASFCCTNHVKQIALPAAN
jgi:hypothetical protein